MAGEEDATAIVVRQHSRTVDFLWGVLVLGFGIALYRGHAGAGTAAGRLAGDAVFGGLMAVCVAAWVWFRRRPSTLTISRDAISFSHRSRSPGIVLRRTGDLYVATPLGPGGKHRQRYLKAEGSDELIPLVLFDWRAVTEACLAMGWRFVARS